MNNFFELTFLQLFLLISVFTVGLSTVGCNQKPLDPKLQAIDCPSSEKNSYVETYYGNTRIKQICMPKEEMKKMDGLDCKDKTVSSLQVCEYADRILLFADENNKVHIGHPASGAPSKGVTTFSIEPVTFTPPNTDNSSSNSLFQSYKLDQSQLNIPKGFEPINDVTCSNSTGVIHNWDGCGFRFKHGDSEWYFNVGISAASQGNIPESDAIDAINSWSKYLPLLLEMKS